MADDNLSYWQRGCNDAKAGKPRTPPFTAEQRCFPPTGWTSYGMSLASRGYDNGYDWATHPGSSMPVLYREVHLGPGHTPTACGPIKREMLRPPVLRMRP